MGIGRLPPPRLGYGGCTPLGQSGRVSCYLKRTDEGLVRELYGALPLSYSATFTQSRWWDSNPQPPALQACTPTGSRSVFNGRRGGGQRCSTVEPRPARASVQSGRPDLNRYVLQPGSRLMCSRNAQRSFRRDGSVTVNVVPAGSWASLLEEVRRELVRTGSPFQRM